MGGHDKKKEREKKKALLANIMVIFIFGSQSSGFSSWFL
jgi:hypothetical protein